ncbi:MSEP-CTERM sorting domain-containing protein [Aureibacter tunicatorum]|uniref:VIT domain-containing protein n=1 Tax=Aureibacter tunicatorum TaxID=866807 RepID=A0AAE3XN32_9BACT|nr:MSEP-CTERM sorting domain-containing protein [Aureibacter tunicatorum]MDR6238905.1 hypothetical protein [Aureibacter tunicatorum]BDD05168.1 hypothetical protein AUTU_26510 [Aureibacter tunicatorum]
MRNFLNPKWLFVINTLPIAILFFLFFGQFNIIKTLLDESNIHLWKTFGLALGTLGALNITYAIYLTLNKKNVSITYGIASLIAYISFIYLYGYHMNEIIPFSIPRWMISSNLIFYVGTFLMPTLAYSLFILVAHFTPAGKEYKAWVNFLIAIATPITFYLFSQIIQPLWKIVDEKFLLHTIVVFFITITLVFLFFLVRGVYVLSTKKSAFWEKNQLVWKVPIAIILPLIGLSLNNGRLFSEFNRYGSGIFGDFNNDWFYILALVNGILICLPKTQNQKYRLALFTGKCITLSYSFYFFLVFLPFLPFSVIAVIAVGMGFLMLSPLLLFVTHVNELSKEFAYLKKSYAKNLLTSILISGFLTIPIIITTSYLVDRSVLNETLSYLYSPDYSSKYDINKKSLQKTLTLIKANKNRRSETFSSGTPYLSSYFNWLVLDNLTLSDSKINTIEKVFFGHPNITFRSENIQNKDVQISNISTNSTFDTTQNVWKSWVDLEITNNTNSSWLKEYATTFKLPEGCWVSDYYLYVGDKKESGILAEKKSAMWIFSQIRNENRDPGLLHYMTGNKIAFRVFPFAKNEIRKTGIEFLHKEPITLNIDNHSISLGNHTENVDKEIETKNVIYVSKQQKKSLKPIKRKPYFHFLVDASQNQKDNIKDFTHRIEKALKANKPLAENAKISFVNSYINKTSINENWKEAYNMHNFEGGFYLDRAIKTTLFDTYQNKSKTYPVMVVVTDSIQNAILKDDFSDFKFAFPDNNLFFNLNDNGVLIRHSLIESPLEALANSQSEHELTHSVLEYTLPDNSVEYLIKNDEPSIILKKNNFDISESDIKEKNWLSALTMQGQWIAQTLEPKKSENDWVNMVKHSFMSKVMTPLTSYIVVENEAQKAMLKKKQNQVLNANKSLDLGEDVQNMNEPSLLILITLLALVIWQREKIRKRRIHEL